MSYKRIYSECGIFLIKKVQPFKCLHLKFLAFLSTKASPQILENRNIKTTILLQTSRPRD